MDVQFLNALTEVGVRLFSVQEAKNIAEEFGIRKASVPYLLRRLSAQGCLYQLFKGHYAIEDNLLSGPPLHMFEVGYYLSKGGAICCWSAMSYHRLTDQVLSRVYAFSPYTGSKKRSLYRYKIRGVDYFLIQVEQQSLWGIGKELINGVSIPITTLERTLVDGLTYPQDCGGMREVLNAFLLAKDRLNLEAMLQNYQQLSTIVQKRLGWGLEHVGFENLENQLEVPRTSHYDKLDPSGVRRGKYNKKWMLVENF